MEPNKFVAIKVNAKRAMTRLDMLQSSDVITWLRNRAIVAGDTYESLAQAAAQDLKIPILRATHVKERMQQLELKLLRPVINAYDDVGTLAMAVAHLYRRLGEEMPSDLDSLVARYAP